jgi:hypothetical protein
VSIPRNGRVGCRRVVLRRWLPSLLRGAVVIEWRTLTRSVCKGAVAALSGRAETHLWALDAVLNRTLPICRTLLLHKPLARRRRRSRSRFQVYRPTRADGVEGRSGRRRHSNAVGVVLKAALNPVTRRQERVEPLDQVGMASEQLRDTVDNSRGVDTTYCQQNPTPRGRVTYVWLLKSFIISRNLL